MSHMVLHDSLLHRNSSTRAQASISASYMTKMNSSSYRAFLSEVSFPCLSPCSCLFCSRRRKIVSAFVCVSIANDSFNPHALIPCRKIHVRKLMCEHSQLGRTIESKQLGKHRIRIKNFIVHKEASFDLWDQSIRVFLICVSFLRRGIHTLKHKVSMCE